MHVLLVFLFVYVPPRWAGSGANGYNDLHSMYHPPTLLKISVFFFGYLCSQLKMSVNGVNVVVLIGK